MPKFKRCTNLDYQENGSKKGSKLQDIGTDLSKSFNENIENRFQHWEKVEKEIIEYKQSIVNLKDILEKTSNTPKNRPKISDWRAQIEEFENKINRLKRSNDQIEYLFCVANVIKETENNISKTEKSSTETIRVNANGPLKPRIKKKKIPFQITNDMNTFTVKPITSQLSSYEMFSGITTEKVKSSKKLAQALHELPIESSDVEYCPKCITSVMQFNEKPPSLYCKCGLSIIVLDNTSAAVHDKETITHIPFTYRPKLHFISWVRRISGKLKFTIPEWVTDEIYYKLHLRKIFDVNLVTWEIIDDIIRTAAKNDKRFTDFYPHVYQITNIIRGRAILVFMDDEEQEIFEYFDPIYILWESKKHLFYIERSNFMYNALVLQIIFMILNYPPSVIRIFNMIKGDSNLRFYDNIIKMICKELGEKPFTTSELEIMKHGKGKDIIESLKKMNQQYQIESVKEKSECSVLLDF